MDTFFVDIFAELGRRLEDFGRDDRSRQVVARAVAENPWFTERGMIAAATALRERMLDRAVLAEWAANYHRAGLPFPAPRPGSAGRTLGIVMAGNVPFVGFADLLYGLFCGYECHIHTSSKDSPGMSFIADTLEEISPLIRIRRTLTVAPDALIATGGVEAVRTLAARYPEARGIFRGPRSSIAVLSGKEGREEQEALADDIFSHSGLGCRNVSLLMVPRGADMRRLADSFRVFGPVNPAYRNNYAQNRALALMAGGEGVIDGGFFTLCPGEDFPSYVSRINYLEYDEIRQVDGWVARLGERLQCVVSNFYPHPAAVAPGMAQRPGLADYPDGVDVVRELVAG